MKPLIHAIVLCLALAVHVRAADSPGPLSQRWVMLYANMADDKQVEVMIGRMEEAARVGYTHVLAGDSKWVKWDKQDGHYLENVKKVRDASRRLKLAFIAGVAPIGYSNDLLSRDPNLAEGMPVVDAPFIVKDGKLVPAGVSPLVNGDFAKHDGNTTESWEIDQPGKIAFVDTDAICNGKPSIRIQDVPQHDKHGRGRILQRIKVKPFTYYHLSLSLRGEGYGGKEVVAVSPIGNGEGAPLLNFLRIRIADKQDEWKRIDHCFNTLDSTEINLYIGTWAGKPGKLWIADVKLEPAGFVNVLRRDGTPLKITSADGKTTYTEGKDFANVVDPKMGNDPRLGIYTVWHDQPTIAIPAGSAIKEGDTVLASYYHATITAWEQVTCCFNDPKIMEIMKWHFEQVHKHVQPDGYQLSHDEIRVQGWDLTCQATKKPVAQMLADNISQCAAMLKKEDPDKPIYILNDLFDPNHNAGKTPYWLVKGAEGWYGSWKGLPKDAIIINWNGFDPEKRMASLKFYEQLGHQQILAGYYDAPVEKIVPWLKDAADIKGVIGIGFFTWGNNYQDMKAFLDAAGLTADGPASRRSTP